MKRIAIVLSIFAIAIATAAHAQCDLDKILPQLDGNRMKATVDKLVSFGTRHSLSPKIVDARTWIFDELSKIPGVSVRYQSSTHSGPRTNNQPVEFVNVVATIKGTSDPDRIYIATGHYDSVNGDQKDTTGPAPGADDDASGTAVIMELARVLGQHPAKATIVLAAVSGEEQGLYGSQGLADEAAAQKWNVEGDITNDIVGGISGLNGAIDNRTVRIFSANETPNAESSSRHWARFIRDGVRQWLPNVRPFLVYRLDRYARGGDHRPFFEKGFPAVRFTEGNEDYRHQHQNVRVENGVHYGDLPEFVSGDYMRVVAGVNAVALVTGACAPAAPRNVKVLIKAGQKDTTMSWDAADDADHYEIVVRDTTADEWEKVLPIGKVATYTIPDVTIDNAIIGVRAVGADGRRSPVRTPPEPGAKVPGRS
jgi:Zn-dependent M28 family amino/carboxypeptidase